MRSASGAPPGNLAIVVPNTVAFLVGVATIILAWRFRQGALPSDG